MKRDIAYTILLLLGILFVSIAYAKNNGNFWKFFDTGYLIIFAVFFFAITEYNMIRIVALLLFCGVLNSWCTSVFFDVTKYEWNQTVFSWATASLFFSLGVIYTYVQFRTKREARRKELLCKREARNKYRKIINKVGYIEEKLDQKNNTLDDIFTKILDV